MMKKNLIIKNDKMNILFLLFFGETNNIIQSFIKIVKKALNEIKIK